MHSITYKKWATWAFTSASIFAGDDNKLFLYKDGAHLAQTEARDQLAEQPLKILKKPKSKANGLRRFLS
jgi:hypothetical protein